MRKRIETQVETQVETEVNPYLTAYQKLAKRMPYNMDRDTDTNFLDQQDGLQDAIIKVLESNPVVDSPLAFLKTAAKNATIDAARHFECMKVEFFGDDIDTMDMALPNGSIVDLRNALQATLEGQEYDVFTAHSQGYTLAEIAVVQGIKHDMQVKRILYRASRKVENLGIAYWIDAKVETYQGKAGRPNCYYAPATGEPGTVVNRQFLCLDQSKPARQVMPTSYQGDMNPTNKIAAVEIASDTDSTSYNVRLQDMTYSDSSFGPFEKNVEVNFLYHNKAEYNKMVRDGMTVIHESRYDISFAHNPVGEWTSQHLMSINGKYKDFTIADIQTVADRFSIGETASVIEKTREAIKAWPVFAKDAGINTKEMDRIKQLHLLLI